MAKTVIDFKDYEGDKYETYTGDDPRPGWYTFELQTVGWYGEDGETLRWILVIADGPFSGWPGMVFGNMDSTKWKNQEMARAIQGGIEKPLAVDFDKPKEVEALVKRAKRVRGKVALNTNPQTQETRLSLRKVAPLLEDTSTTRKGAPADDLDEADELNGTVDDVVEGEDGDYTEDELGEMALADLKGILKDEFEYNARQLRSIKDEDAAIDAILAAQEEEDADDPEAGDDTDAEGDFDDDFADGDTPAEDPEPEPEPRRRRGAAATKAAPAKAAPAKAAPAKAAAPVQRTTRRRRA